jgi:hypothetical protein
MRLLPRRVGASALGTLIAFVGAFILVHVLAPNWARAVGLDVWEVRKDMADRQGECLRERELEDQLSQLTRQVGAAQVVIDALIDGRISLETAVRQLAEINLGRPGFEDVLRTVYPENMSPRARLGLYTIGHVRSNLDTNPDKQKKVLARLENEFCEFTASDM